MVKTTAVRRLDMNQPAWKMLVSERNNLHLWDQIADGLAGPGYLVLDNQLPAEMVKNLLQRLGEVRADSMRPAGIGRGQELHQNQQVRGDSIAWHSMGDPIEAEFLSWMDELRQALNQCLYLGLMDYESHFAVYPAGSFYQKHLDSFREMQSDNRPRRKISTVLYLNPEWTTDKAGELIIYDEKGESILESVSPILGRMVIFVSDRFPHEVKAASETRCSIAGWFRCR